MRFSLLLLISCSLTLSLSVNAQQSSPPPQTSSALLLQSYTAMVGTNSISDVTLTGTARRIAGSLDESGTATLKALLTGEASLNFSYPSGPFAETRTNISGMPQGQWTGPDGKTHAISGHNLITDSSWFFPPLTLSKIIASQTYTATLVGQVERYGKLVNDISISQQPSSSNDLPPEIASLMQHLSQMDLYVDTATGLPSALVFNTHPDTNALVDLPVEIRFSDYRSVMGVTVPFHIQRYLNNSLVLDLQFTTLGLNSGLSSSMF